MAKTKITTSTGYECSISDDALNDMRVLDYLRDMDEGKVYVMRDLLDLIIGEKQRLKLYDHITEKCGKPAVDVMQKELQEIFSLLKATQKK